MQFLTYKEGSLSMLKAADVLIFDSGVGGLSILQAIRAELPQLRLAFVADNAGLPYGNKEASWLVQRVNDVIAKAMHEVEAKLVVIACNTASTLVLPSLRARYQVPIVGVVPAIKPAAQLSTRACIGLLATQATVQRGYTDALIQDFAAHCQVIRVGSARLVEMAEAKMRGDALDLNELRAILAPFAEASPPPDVIVLGCTHFPLLHKELKEILPDVSWLDSGHAIAQRVKTLTSSLPPKNPTAREWAYFTRFDTDAQALSNALQAFGLGAMRSLEIPLP